MRQTQLNLACGLLITAALSFSALAQAGDDKRLGGVRSVPPRPMSGLSRPMSGLGGVKSQPGVRVKMPGFTAPIRNPAGFTPGRPSVSRPSMNTNFPSSGGSHSSGVIGNGLTVSGVYRDGPFTLKFTTGGSGRILLPNGGCIIPVYCGGYAALCPYGYIGSYFSNGSYFSSGYYAEPMYSSYSPPTTQTVSYTPAAEPAPAPVTAQDRAAAKLRFGDAKGAVAAYQAILKKEPHDAQSMRALGLSLIDAGRTGDGVAVIALAYRSDTTLAGTPVDPGAFGKSGELRSNLNRVSSYANREKSASAWLALAVLMQAEGRPRQAMAMIERAKTAGLEDQIVQEMTAALSGSEEAAAD